MNNIIRLTYKENLKQNEQVTLENSTSVDMTIYQSLCIFNKNTVLQYFSLLFILSRLANE